jgi:hypothetical protein
VDFGRATRGWRPPTPQKSASSSQDPHLPTLLRIQRFAIIITSTPPRQTNRALVLICIRTTVRPQLAHGRDSQSGPNLSREPLGTISATGSPSKIQPTGLRGLRCKPTPEFSEAACMHPAACNCLGQGRPRPAGSENVIATLQPAGHGGCMQPAIVTQLQLLG